MAQKTILFNELGVEERMNLYNSVIGVIRRDTPKINTNVYTDDNLLFHATSDGKSVGVYDLYDTAILVTNEYRSVAFHSEGKGNERRDWYDYGNCLYKIRIIGESGNTFEATRKLGLEKYLKD